ncbi:helix-turn-helix domain-containing protein [Bacillus benzoevorans]|uniref:Putative transcriptional regulator n=1 Tax=Bacillus benzoevorans TaxID=1456 RepID=A0A7X0LWX9_9BACI|nr:helix-turn-helix transcriptional regulator [Bacillus benzoevorans]MBB6447040.1 putative transcriptional regulator [Bacillus benzoevorans]
MKISLKDPVQFRIILMEKGYSQRQFSKEISTSEAYLNQIINLKKHPSPDVAKKITEKLQMEFNGLFIIE